MKTLIWLGCAFCYAFIFAGFSSFGITLGGIPTMLLCGCLFLIGRHLCKAYDSTSNDTIEQGEAPPVTAMNEQLSSSDFVSMSNETDSSIEKSNPISEPPKKYVYISSVIVNLLLLIICAVLGYSYYFDIQDKNQTIYDAQNTIQQLESDLNTANDWIAAHKSDVQTIQKNDRDKFIYFYNEGITDGYYHGYNDAAKLKGKAKVADDLWERIELMKSIEPLYRKYSD